MLVTYHAMIARVRCMTNKKSGFLIRLLEGRKWVVRESPGTSEGGVKIRSSCVLMA